MDYSGTRAGVHRSDSGRSGHSSISSKSDRNAPAVMAAEHPDDNAIYDETGPPPVKVETKSDKNKPAKKERGKTIKLKVTRDQDRDPKEIATAIKIGFEDIIAEPDRGLYSFDEVWNASRSTYACCRLWWYRILTLICGIPAACCWGISFACLSCCASWCWAPQLKCFQVVLAYVRLFVEAILGCCIEPCCFAYGKYWSRIRVVVRHEGKNEQLVV